MPTFLHLCTVVFTVALLCVTAYFLLGSIPLLILRHDNPLDGNFVRSFFNLYYKMAMFVATAAALSYAFSNRLLFAVGAAVIGLLSYTLRRIIIAKMDLLKAQIQTQPIEAIPEFRKIHFVAILFSVAQLIAVIASLFALKL